MLVGLRRWETAAKEKRGRGEEREKETASEREKLGDPRWLGPSARNVLSIYSRQQSGTGTCSVVVVQREVGWASTRRRK